MPHAATGRAHAAARIHSLESLFEQMDDLSEEETSDLLYSRAHDEVRSHRVERGQYARAFSLADGDNAKADARYIQLRVEALNRAYQDWQEDEANQQDARRLEAEQDAQTTLTSVALFVVGLLLVILIF